MSTYLDALVDAPLLLREVELDESELPFLTTSSVDAESFEEEEPEPDPIGDGGEEAVPVSQPSPGIPSVLSQEELESNIWNQDAG